MGKDRDLTWLPLADWVNALSIEITQIGVLLVRAVSLASTESARYSFAFAALLPAGYPVALAGHYDMLNPKTSRSYRFCTLQEAAAISVIAGAAILLAVLGCGRVWHALGLILPLIALALCSWWNIFRAGSDEPVQPDELAEDPWAIAELEAMVHKFEALSIERSRQLLQSYKALLVKFYRRRKGRSLHGKCCAREVGGVSGDQHLGGRCRADAFSATGGLPGWRKWAQAESRREPRDINLMAETMRRYVRRAESRRR